MFNLIGIDALDRVNLERVRSTCPADSCVFRLRNDSLAVGNCFKMRRERRARTERSEIMRYCGASDVVYLSFSPSLSHFASYKNTRELRPRLRRINITVVGEIYGIARCLEIFASFRTTTMRDDTVRARARANVDLIAYYFPSPAERV